MADRITLPGHRLRPADHWYRRPHSGELLYSITSAKRSLRRRQHSDNTWANCTAGPLGHDGRKLFSQFSVREILRYSQRLYHFRSLHFWFHNSTPWIGRAQIRARSLFGSISVHKCGHNSIRARSSEAMLQGVRVGELSKALFAEGNSVSAMARAFAARRRKPSQGPKI